MDFSLESILFGTPASNSTAIPKKRILSSQSRLKIMHLDNSEELYLGEVNEFKMEQNFEPVKQWQPYGFKTKKTIVKPAGWNIEFSAEKVDWNLAYFVYANERTMLGEDIGAFPSSSNTFDGNGVIGNNILFAIEHETRYVDGTLEKYIFKDVVIVNYQIEVPADNQIIPERVVAFSPERIIDHSFSQNHKISKITSSVDSIIALLNNTNKS